MRQKIFKFLRSKEGLLVITIFAIAVFLRFYRFSAFVTFLGDQGRDAIVVKRILTLEHFPAIGPATSVGQLYLGPFYYYFIAPWLAIFGLDPLGPAFGLALLSSIFIVVQYFIVRELFNRQTALISSFLSALSIVLIDFSRFSWNPNLLPFFSLFAVYFLVKSWQKKHWFYYVLAGAFLSFSMQLHYLAVFLLPAALIFLIWRKTLSGIFFVVSSFLFFSFPLLIFDLRHDFLNTRSFISFIKQSSAVLTNKINGLVDSFFYLNKYLFNTELNTILSSILLLLIFVVFLIQFKKQGSIFVFIFFFLFLLAGVSLYGGPKHPHYLGLLYLLYIIILSYFLSHLTSTMVGKSLILFFLFLYVLLNARSYYFFTNKGNYQIRKAKNAARIIAQNANYKKYALTALPEQYSDWTYRYFLEIWNKKPIDKDNLEKVKELFVVCEGKCRLIGNPQWDIAHFAANKIANSWKSDDVTIYKLVR